MLAPVLDPVLELATRVLPGAATVRDGLARGAAGLFAQGGDNPMEHTLDYVGDPGLYGPDSVSWRLVADPASMIGGIRALLVQATHPEVTAGVEDHSTYRTDPLGRLSRTAAFVAVSTYGAMPEVEQIVKVVRRAHRPVHGESERGIAYRASDPALASWVHNGLVDSLLVSYQNFGAHRLSRADADRFVVEQQAIARMLGADDLPDTAADLRDWIIDHPHRRSSAAMRHALRFLRNPPLPLLTRGPYQALLNAAVATLPAPIRWQLRAPALPGARAVGESTIIPLRWALGWSPLWLIALARVDRQPPPNVRFRIPDPRTTTEVDEHNHR